MDYKQIKDSFLFQWELTKAVFALMAFLTFIQIGTIFETIKGWFKDE